jgi:hypothetical protein
MATARRNIAGSEARRRREGQNLLSPFSFAFRPRIHTMVVWWRETGAFLVGSVLYFAWKRPPSQIKEKRCLSVLISKITFAYDILKP